MLIQKISFRDVRSFRIMAFVATILMLQILGLLAGCSHQPQATDLLTGTAALNAQAKEEQKVRSLNCPKGSTLYCDHRKLGPNKCQCASVIMWQ